MALVCVIQVRGLLPSHAYCLHYNSRVDMDLCCLIDSAERLAASDLVTMLGDLLERGKWRIISQPLCMPHFALET